MRHCEYLPLFPKQFRCMVVSQMEEASQTDSALDWEEWKRLFYHWKKNRDFWGVNEIQDELSFSIPSTEIII